MKKTNSVFQYVLFHNSETESAVIEHGFVVASSAEQAKLIAARKLDASWDTHLNEVEVLVRPF